MVCGQESLPGWIPDCSSDYIDFGDLVFLRPIPEHGEDQSVCRLDSAEHSALPAFFRAFCYEPVVEMEFLSNHRFGICFVVGGLLDSFTHLQNLANPPAGLSGGGIWETAGRCIS